MRDTLFPPPRFFRSQDAAIAPAARRVHEICTAAVWKSLRFKGRIRAAILALVWPLTAAAVSFQWLWQNAAAIKAMTGKGAFRQFAEIMGLATRHMVSPKYYYMYEFYLPERMRQAGNYLMRYETKQVAYRLLRPVAEITGLPIKDKIAFAVYCRERGLPVVPLVAAFRDGRRIPEVGGEAPPDGDLFVKRVFGKGGAGAERWNAIGDGNYRSTRGQELTLEKLLERVAELSRKEPYLIQPALTNHAELRELSLSALSTVRLLTVRDEKGGFEVTNASYRMSANPKSAVDNIHAGGIAAPVDLATGRLGPASDLGLGPRFAWHDVHPATGARIAGRILPFWPEAMALARRAHGAFADWTVIGWDVAILDDGPRLIEGNKGPDVDLIQRPLRGPTGSGRFGELLAYNLEHQPLWTEVEAEWYRVPIKVRQFPPPHLLLWPGHPEGSAIRRLRRAYRAAWQRRFGLADYLRIAAGWLLWPLVAVALSIRTGLKLGAPLARAGGPGVPRQIAEQIRLAVLYRIAPRYYYIFELHRPELGRRAAEYLTRVETKSGIYRALKLRGDREKVVRINDKLSFSSFFGRNGLRVVPVLAAYRAGLKVGNVGEGSLPEGQDLFVKKIEGRGGIGAQLWQAQPHGRYRSSRGEECTLEELTGRVRDLSRQGDYLIQPRLKNHPDIADLTPGALSTVRLLTILNERGEPEAVNAAFRMAVSKESAVDNFHAGGIAAAVDMATGTLGPGTGLGLGGDFRWHETHPVTGGRIKDRRLPHWEEAVALAIAAHRLVAPRVMVGWDIAFLPEGPCLIEGNTGPDADIHQRTELRPIGNARYGALLAWHMERRLGLEDE